ncbi:Nse4 C-terminal-domain-containing protein [Suillus clintonianus]|uniref:Nse4 C-terminal-domain-containing protein n=1 Tax=Suillus clintonianus TaxID=1904413 RepID=UPI001B8768B9|nr:Nse4 C-terminal-domain-containing protein [Suillus clintonianus]KAG2124015.1 Nse4 C-terminal-domain-containing protein [Suillus clintonianus]
MLPRQASVVCALPFALIDSQIQQILQRTGSVNLFRFVINPKDFAQSVENLFCLSFLFRDGLCALWVDSRGEPVIQSCSSTPSHRLASGVVRHQLIMEFDMATWRKAIDVFNITEAMIPHRVVAKNTISASTVVN